jgi:hypothetical protein
MSHRNIFFGILGDEVVFNSGEGNELNGGEMKKYLPKKFYNHSLVKNERNGLKLLYHILVYNPTSFGIAFYLTDSDLYHGGDLKSNLDQSRCSILCHLDTEDNDMDIQDLKVDTAMRGKGLAQYLITLSLLYCNLFSEDIVLCKLDDASDNNANGIEDTDERIRYQNMNIYYKMGFRYEQDSGPEMEGNIASLLAQNIGKFIKKRKASRTLSSSSSAKTKKRRSRTLSSSSSAKTKKRRPITRSQTRIN